MNYSWKEQKNPYEVKAEFIDSISTLSSSSPSPSYPSSPTSPNSLFSPPLFFVKSGIENKMTSGAVGTSPSTVFKVAKFEAWERYCLGRLDLALAADDECPHMICNENEKKLEPSMIYFSQLARPLAMGPKYVEGIKVNHNDYESGANNKNKNNKRENNNNCRILSEWIYFNDNPSVTNTSGAAYGSDLQDAVQYAYQELMERHFLMTCYLGISMAKLIKRNEQICWYELGIHDDVVSVLCIVSDTHPPYVTVGCSANKMDSLEEALTKSFYEAVAARRIWEQKISLYGVKGFLERGDKIINTDPSQVGLIEGAWYWAARKEGADVLHEIFTSSQMQNKKINFNQVHNPQKLIAVDVGRNILTSGAVVKVFHPDVLPLPSYYSHLLHLSKILSLGYSPLPLPLT